MTQNWYEVLQVSKTAEAEVITAAYRKLAAKYHPDHNKAADANERMQLLNLAYECLRDPTKRAAYDRQQQSQTAYGRQQPTERIRVRIARFLERDAFDEVIATLHEEDGLYDSRTKTWTLPADADIPDECEEVEE